MNEAAVDLLIFLVIIGVAVLICSALLCGIYRLIGKIQDCNEVRRRRETAKAIKLYYLVKQQIRGELTPAEYDQAVRLTLAKYPNLADRSGGLNMRRIDPERVAELISEAYRETVQKGEKIA